jgi:hypothetical protein
MILSQTCLSYINYHKISYNAEHKCRCRSCISLLFRLRNTGFNRLRIILAFGWIRLNERTRDVTVWRRELQRELQELLKETQAIALCSPEVKSMTIS